MALLAACVDSSAPVDCAAPAVTRQLTLSDGRLVPETITVCRGQAVTLVVEVEDDGILHVHGYDEALPATEVRTGQTAELQFTADRSGQFIIELHPTGDDEGGEAGILTVHER